MVCRHIRHTCPLEPNSLIPPVNIEMQIYDLKSLLNEMEAENGLHIICVDILTGFEH